MAPRMYRIGLVIGVATASIVAVDSGSCRTAAADPSRPHIVLVMADDQGWGQTGYNGHPILRTPNLDAMASSGLRFNRFYAGAPVCSPTRASVLTGRTNDRTGVLSHGYALRRQEITVAQILQQAGYVTAHFGKWHLNGLRGPGVPILSSDNHHPGHFGFDHWLSVTNFFDRDPILSRMGEFEEFAGDSSEIIVDQALRFLTRQRQSESPTFTVIWYGTPHSPFQAAPQDLREFDELSEDSRHHYGELVAMDRSVGALRQGLRRLGIAQQTLVWFCSDNGGLPRIQPTTVKDLRGFKGSVHEGGLRVPGIIEWPAVVRLARQTEYPAGVCDMLPTILEITGLSHPDPPRPLDGVSLLPLLSQEIGSRSEPLFFRHNGKAALIDNDWKMVTNDINGDDFKLYNLIEDPAESIDLYGEHPQRAAAMRAAISHYGRSVDDSAQGKDYPAGKVDDDHPEPRFWTAHKDYEAYFDLFRPRWQYKSWMKARGK